MAGLVRMPADLVAGLHVQHAQRPGMRLRRQLTLHGGQRLQRQPMARALGREKEQLVQALAGAGLEHGKNRAQRLAYARRRLHHQAAPARLGVRAAVHGHGQLALPRAKTRHGKLQRGQRRIARLAMGGLAARPGQKARAQVFEKNLQRPRFVRFDQHRFLPGAHIEVHQRHAQPRQPARLAQQMAVDAGLRPMQRAMMGAHAVERTAIGLDLFELPGLRIEAVGAAAHAQVLVLARQADFGFVALAPARLHQAVAGHAFERAGRGREAQIQIARARREFAQRAHSHGVAHQTCSIARSRHCTWQTRAGMPCAAQYCSQRIWLSCSLSPGALTSTSS